MDLYENCRLCPRDCGVDRTVGDCGICGETSECRISSIGPHFGEEPSFSGTRGSGTIFFSGCSSRCFFCQNYQISLEHGGEVLSPERFVERGRTLAKSGVHNINFVTPDHFWPHIQLLCATLRSEGVTIPFLFNSSGYQRADMIEAYAESIDIFMPDFKFADGELAEMCMGDSRYPKIALAALSKMVELKGFLDPWDPAGEKPAKSGVLVRHLILPGYVENSLAVLRLLRREFGALLPISVMSQFHPIENCHRRNALVRRITLDEYRNVHDLVLELGFRHVYMQSIPDSTDFLPDFDRDEPFEGNARRKC